MTSYITTAVLWVGSGIMALAAAADSGTTAVTDQVGLIGLVTNLGLSGIFLWQWRHAETIREELSKELLALAREVFPMVAEATSTMDRMDLNAGRSAQEMLDVASKFRDGIAELKAVNDFSRRSGDR